MTRKSKSSQKANDQIARLRAKLEVAEKNGFTNDSKEDILKISKELLKR